MTAVNFGFNHPKTSVKSHWIFSYNGKPQNNMVTMK